MTKTKRQYREDLARAALALQHAVVDFTHAWGECEVGDDLPSDAAGINVAVNGLFGCDLVDAPDTAVELIRCIRAWADEADHG